MGKFGRLVKSTFGIKKLGGPTSFATRTAAPAGPIDAPTPAPPVDTRLVPETGPPASPRPAPVPTPRALPAEASEPARIDRAPLVRRSADVSPEPDPLPSRDPVARDEPIPEFVQPFEDLPPRDPRAPSNPPAASPLARFPSSAASIDRRSAATASSAATATATAADEASAIASVQNRSPVVPGGVARRAAARQARAVARSAAFASADARPEPGPHPTVSVSQTFVPTATPSASHRSASHRSSPRTPSTPPARAVPDEETLRRAATTLQSHARGALARSETARKRAMRRADALRAEERRETNAAVAIQAAARGMRARIRARTIRDERVSAAAEEKPSARFGWQREQAAAIEAELAALRKVVVEAAAAGVVSRSPEIIGEWRRGGVDVVGARVGAPPASAPATATRTRTRTPPPRWERGRATRRSPGTPRGPGAQSSTRRFPTPSLDESARDSSPWDGSTPANSSSGGDSPTPTRSRARRSGNVVAPPASISPGSRIVAAAEALARKFHENPLWDEAVGDVDGAALAAARSPSPWSKTKPTATRDSSASWSPSVRGRDSSASWSPSIRGLVSASRPRRAPASPPGVTRGSPEATARFEFAAATSPTIRRRLGASRRVEFGDDFDAATASRDAAMLASYRRSRYGRAAATGGDGDGARRSRVSAPWSRLHRRRRRRRRYGGGGALDRALVGASTLRARSTCSARLRASRGERPRARNRTWTRRRRAPRVQLVELVDGEAHVGLLLQQRMAEIEEKLARAEEALRARDEARERSSNDDDRDDERHANAVLVESETSGENAVAAEERAAEERASVVSDDVSDASSAPSTVPEASTSDVDPEDFATPLASLDVSFETTRADARSDGIPEATIFETTNLEASADASFESATSATEATIAAAEATARERRRAARSRRDDACRTRRRDARRRRWIPRRARRRRMTTGRNAGRAFSATRSIV